MILIEEKLSVKLPCLTSLFINNTFYSRDAYDRLVQSENCFYDKNSNVFEFTPNCLQFLVDFLINYDDVKFVARKTKSKSIKKVQHKYKVKPYQHQEQAVEYGANRDGGWLLLDEQGLGKAVDLDTKVFTPDGYKLMRDIHVGDYVFDRRGNPVKVLQEFYHENAEMYKITFSDGVSIKCCKDHLWKIYAQHGSKVVPTSWFVGKDQFGRSRQERLHDGDNIYRYHIDLCDEVQFNHRDVPIDPYILGCLIGDGSLREHSACITSADDFILNQFHNRLPDDTTLHRMGSSKYDYAIVGSCAGRKNTVLGALRDLSLSGVKSQLKFVPDIYKYNDIDTRKQVLRGLMDTDGYAQKKGNCAIFSSTSKQLVDDVVFLVQSIGGVAFVSSRQCGYRVGGIRKITGTVYNVTIRYKNPQELFLLPRKRELLKPRKFLPRRNIAKIEKIENSPAKCITVDGDEHLYLIEHFVVTHNTSTIINLAEVLKKQEGLEHCFIICGVNGLKFNWANEIKKFSNLSYTILGQKVSRTGRISFTPVTERIKQLKNGIKEFFVITNVETLQNKDFANAFNKSRSKFDMIVLDEAHHCKTPTTASVKTLLKLKAKRCIALTGTVIMNVPEDCYVPLKWTGNTKSTFTQFKRIYNVYGGFGGVQVVGHKNLELLQELLSSCSLRRLKSEVLDLPDKTYQIEYVELGSKQQKLYDEVAQGIAIELDKLDHTPTILEEITINMRLRQITAYPGVLSTEVTQSAKIDRLVDLVEDITSQGDKVVVFCTFKSAAEEVCKRLDKYGALLCTGNQTDDEINNNKKLFEENEQNKVLVCTWQKMGTGHTLTSANYAIFLDTPWTDADFQQASDRIHRIGQNKKVFIITLIAKDTYDERVQEILERKECLSGYLVDNKEIV